MLPQIAQGDSNKLWLIPSELTQALAQLGSFAPRHDNGVPGSNHVGERVTG